MCRQSSILDSGPTIPVEIRDAHDRGTLVLFCGAGVSHPAGYPLFAQLVDYIYETLPGHVPDALEKNALQDKAYDRALHLLEQRLQDNNAVRTATIQRLTRRPKTLAVHEALLHLATQVDGVHLVTTNFDTLFAKAHRKLRYKTTEIDAAPKLPVPKSKKWDSIVHLHGLIDNASDPNGRRLVLTTADFGAAYLTERWASRFTSELFRRYTVLFVGYRADDIVMRYILDALDADLRLREDVYPPFAFAGCDPNSDLAPQLDDWKAKGVQPIPYPVPDNDHTALIRHLKQWAADWRDGLEGRANIVSTLSPLQPSLPPPERERYLWALRDPSGVPARELVISDSTNPAIPRAPLAWFDDFSAAGFLASTTDELHHGLADEFFGLRHTASGLPLSPRGWQFISWIRSHLSDIALYRKAAQVGGSLHPDVITELRRSVIANASNDSRTHALSLAWLLLTSPAISLPAQAEMSFSAISALCDALRQWPNTQWLDHDILFALTPFVRFRDPIDRWQLRAALGYETPTSPETSDLLSGTVVLRCHTDADLIAGTLAGTSTPFLRLAPHLALLLERALNLQQLVGGVSPSAAEVQIRQLPQAISDTAPRLRQWSLLVDIAWSAFLECDDRNPPQAGAIFHHWIRSAHPVELALAVKAASESRTLTSRERLRALLRPS